MKRTPIRIGQQFGRWTVLGPSGRPTHWQCRCECGTARIVFIGSLNSGISQSCGCLKRELSSARRLKHGLTDTAEHVAWMQMRRRCESPTATQYAHYGGRGIQVCERWSEFKNFLADLGPRPSASHSLDRIDPEGHYEPSNCRWADREQQSQNRRWNKLTSAIVARARLLSRQGLTSSEIQRRLGISCHRSTMNLAIAGKTWKNVPVEVK